MSAARPDTSLAPLATGSLRSTSLIASPPPSFRRLLPSNAQTRLPGSPSPDAPSVLDLMAALPEPGGLRDRTRAMLEGGDASHWSETAERWEDIPQVSAPTPSILFTSHTYSNQRELWCRACLLIEQPCLRPLTFQGSCWQCGQDGSECEWPSGADHTLDKWATRWDLQEVTQKVQGLGEKVAKTVRLYEEIHTVLERKTAMIAAISRGVQPGEVVDTPGLVATLKWADGAVAKAGPSGFESRRR